MMLAVTAFAQPDAGTLSIKPKVGLNIAYFGESQASFSLISDISNSPRLGIAAGLEFEYQVKERIGLTVGAIYSQQGERAEINPRDMWSSSVSMTAKVDYINFPVIVDMYLCKGFALRLGIQPGVNVRDSYGGYNERTVSLSELGINIKKFDLSIPFGLSYEYECFVIEARYNLGVVNIVDSSDKTWNRGVQVTAGLKFNL